MILSRDPLELSTAAPPPMPYELGEARERRQALIACLKRMGFYDPESLIDSDAQAERERAAATSRRIRPIASA